MEEPTREQDASSTGTTRQGYYRAKKALAQSLTRLPFAVGMMLLLAYILTYGQELAWSAAAARGETPLWEDLTRSPASAATTLALFLFTLATLLTVSLATAAALNAKGELTAKHAVRHLREEVGWLGVRRAALITLLYLATREAVLYAEPLVCSVTALEASHFSTLYILLAAGHVAAVNYTAAGSRDSRQPEDTASKGERSAAHPRPAGPGYTALMTAGIFVLTVGALAPYVWRITVDWLWVPMLAKLTFEQMDAILNIGHIMFERSPIGPSVLLMAAMYTASSAVTASYEAARPEPSAPTG